MCCPLHVGVVLPEADLREGEGICWISSAKTTNNQKPRDLMIRQKTLKFIGYKSNLLDEMERGSEFEIIEKSLRKIS